MKNTQARNIVANLAFRSRLAKRLLREFEANHVTSTNQSDESQAQLNARQWRSVLQGQANESWNAYVASRYMLTAADVID